MMERRKALALLGTLVAFFLGKPEAKGINIGIDFDANLEILKSSKSPSSFTVVEDGISDIIIIRKDGSRVTIPFSDVVDALSEIKP